METFNLYRLSYGADAFEYTNITWFNALCYPTDAELYSALNLARMRGLFNPSSQTIEANRYGVY